MFKIGIDITREKNGAASKIFSPYNVMKEAALLKLFTKI